MMETLNIPVCEKRYIVTNKGKILVVTYNRKYAERIDKLVKSNNYPKSYEIVVKK
jgi:hypothetical protein